MFHRSRDIALGRLGAWLHAVGGVCTFTIFLLAWICFFRPIDAAARASRQRADELQEVIADSRHIRNEHGQLAEELNSAQAEADRLTDSVPDKPREAEFLAQITQLADEVGVEIQDYRPKEKSDREIYSIQFVDLMSAGPYASVCQFLARLPALPRHCAVEHLQVTAEPNGEGCRVRMTLRLYFGAKGDATTARDTKQKG